MHQERPLYQIASEVRKTWKNVSPYAKPYLEAMAGLDHVTEMYGADSGRSIVLYFLSNANGWRGDDAKRIKAELKSIVGI